jgi:hypothetical protein
VYVALDIRYAMRLRPVVIWGLSGCTKFLNIVALTARNWGGDVTERKIYVLIFCRTFVSDLSHYKKNSTRCYHKCTWFVIPVIL